ncbi:MAG: hypothetical protein LBH42_04400 [Treponema sp.]|jgi:hypothetical protein|nr:hypothetical protein [Treponema sp.]
MAIKSLGTLKSLIAKRASLDKQILAAEKKIIAEAEAAGKKKGSSVRKAKKPAKKSTAKKPKARKSKTKK